MAGDQSDIEPLASRRHIGIVDRQHELVDLRTKPARVAGFFFGIAPHAGSSCDERLTPLNAPPAPKAHPRNTTALAEVLA
jgi:hypothetical protein